MRGGHTPLYNKRADLFQIRRSALVTWAILQQQEVAVRHDILDLVCLHFIISHLSLHSPFASRQIAFLGNVSYFVYKLCIITLKEKEIVSSSLVYSQT
jgi:hypothetical protein